jgi:hypothetical protein
VSATSGIFLEIIDGLRAEQRGLEAQVNALYSSLFDARTKERTLVETRQTRDELAKLHGLVEGFQCKEVNALDVSALQSGKAEARRLRKEMTTKNEQLNVQISEMVACLFRNEADLLAAAAMEE